MDKKLGRLPADLNRPRLQLRTLLNAPQFTYPGSVDYLSKVGNFPMYMNDKIGDCTCATAGHVIQEITTYGGGNTITVSDNDVLTAYKAVSGYDPATGANDNGAVVQDVLDYWRKTGIGGHKILAFAEVDHRNTDELRAAINLFGTVYLGIRFPDSAYDQFDNDKPWDYVPGAKLLGGHAINAGFYDVSDNMWKIVTWGKVQPMTQAFWNEYVEEAWVVISNEWFNAQGQSPTQLDMHSLGQQFTDITGEANPFPSAPPAPTPAPSPVDDNAVDKALAEKVRSWLARSPQHYKSFQAELRDWLNAKGL